MGKTVESYRIALEQEINRWNGFARALRKDDREAFEELMDMCRSFASESGNATNPIVFETMIMSILLAQQEKIGKLEKNLNAIKPATSSYSISPGPPGESHQVTNNSVKQNSGGGGQTRLS